MKFDNQNEDEEKWRIVKLNHESMKLKCNCKFSNWSGYPCRHELCVIVKQSLSFQVSNINKRWLINLEVIHFLNRLFNSYLGIKV